jgi:hypothetical protein
MSYNKILYNFFQQIRTDKTKLLQIRQSTLVFVDRREQISERRQHKLNHNPMRKKTKGRILVSKEGRVTRIYNTNNTVVENI